MSTTNTTSTTMTAQVFRRTGNPTDILKLEQDYPRPVPTGTELLIEVKAASLNPVGWKGMSTAPLKYMTKVPGVPESDFAGLVAGGNLEGTGLKIGDEVFGISPADVVAKSGVGTLAEYTLAERNMVVKKPSNISFEEAASFPLAGLTAWHSLVDVGGLKKGGEVKKVLINGGSGGVGAWGIQIAKAFGAHVTVTCSPASNALVKSLGADVLIDYKSVDLPSHLASNNSLAKNEAFDIIFDPVGSQPLYFSSPKYLKPAAQGGHYLDLFGGIHMESLSAIVHTFYGLFRQHLLPTFLGGTARKFQSLMLPAGTMREQLIEAAGMLEKGTLKATLDGEFRLADIKKAYEKQMSGRTKGKVVVTI